MRTLVGCVIRLVFATAMLCASVASAQEINVDAALAQAEEAREEVVRANILLTGETAEDFWALYKEYRATLGPVQNDQVNLVVEYSKVYTDISDAQATRLFNQMLALRKRESEIKAEYLEKFRQILSPKHAMRYAQIEHKLDTAIQWDAAVNIPLIDQ